MKRCAVFLAFLAIIGLSSFRGAAIAAEDNAAAGGAATAVESAAPAAEVRERPVESYPDGLIHTVVDGDTLWDLSAKYLGSPWQWPELWARNRFLTNPHFIYPGVKVVIFPPPPKSYALPAAEAAVAKAAAPEPAAPPEPKKTVVPTLDISAVECVRGGEFLADEPRGIGRIRDGELDKVAFSEGDVVYLALNKEIPAGQLLGIYRVRGPIAVPDGSKRSGYVKFLIGIIQVSGTADGVTKGKVRKSFEDLLRRDILTEEIPSYAPVVINAGGTRLESVLITGRNENVEIAMREFVYLSKGSDAGVGVGDVFAIYEDRYPDLAKRQMGAGEAAVKVLAGRAVVTKALPSYATAYVVESRESLTPGDHALRGAPQGP